MENRIESLLQTRPGLLSSEKKSEMIFSTFFGVLALFKNIKHQRVDMLIAGMSIIISIFLGFYAATFLPQQDTLSLSSWFLQIILYCVINIGQYLIFGFIFEFLHRRKSHFSAEAKKSRWKQQKKEIRLGIIALIVVSVFVNIWMRYVVPHTPFYKFYDTHSLAWYYYFLGFFAYFIVADIWFYWSHRALHHRWFFRHVHHVHHVHHQFSNPTAFAQIALHWFEAIIHGPCVYLIPSLVFPVPITLIASLGYMTGIYAVAAHDGRILDLNKYYLHHSYRVKHTPFSNKREVKGINYGIFWGFWDYICGTRFHPEKCIPWINSKQAALHEYNESYLFIETAPSSSYETTAP